jgi:hypothetical protein
MFLSNCFFETGLSVELAAKIASVRWTLLSELKFMILQMQKFSVADESVEAATITSFFVEYGANTRWAYVSVLTTNNKYVKKSKVFFMGMDFNLM